MKYVTFGCILLMYTIGMAHGTCVLESDFGFILNCNFKKSSLFRVRNLGGVKAHFGLGFSLGDELGLAESIGNLEGNKRRSLSQRDQLAVSNIGVLPAAKLPVSSQVSITQNRPKALTIRSPATLPSSTRAPIFYKQHTPVAMTEAKSLPLGVPAFKPLRPSVMTNRSSPKQPNSLDVMRQKLHIQSALQATQALPTNQPPQNTFNRKAAMYQTPNLALANLTFMHAQTQLGQSEPVPISPLANAFKVPAFQAMPSSVTRVSGGQIVQLSPNSIIEHNSIKREDTKPPQHEISLAKPVPTVDLKGHTVEELAAVANVSVDAIKRAIDLRQKQLIADQEVEMRRQLVEQEALQEEEIAKQLALYRYEQQQFLATSTPPTTVPITTTTTTTTTTPRPTTAKRINTTPKARLGGGQKVMNAPKEYYPVGYDKNFDDNFATRVDLPPTAFHCGDQKHFPGLYGDTDLGCMVFHVCALTDDGLIMKSFLCPESTLFDQTILKCNWWFYVDCKSSKNLYDSNLPVSKSYQLMKALTFFSNYNKKSQNGDAGVDLETIKNSVISNKDVNDAAAAAASS